MSSLHLERVTKVLGGRAVVDGVDLEVRDGELLCLLGPSGCGKTTTLRMVAGFGHPDGGRILIDGEDVTGHDPARRPTAMVFQNYALWPHMSVLDNVTFGLRARGSRRKEAASLALEALEGVGMAGAAGRRPASLSGGEQQRVALARALVQRPKVLLLDEPLSNLDAQLRLKVREELAELHQRTGITMLFVTHDQDEALSLADRVAVMSAGRMEQVASPEDLYKRPATAFVAGFVGRISWVPATIVDGSLRSPVDGWPFGARAPELVGAAEGPVLVALRPEDLVPASRGLGATIVRRVPRGHFEEVVLEPTGQGGRAAVGPPPEQGSGALLDDRLWRAYRPAGEHLPEVGSWWPVRVLVYRDGRLLAELERPVDRDRRDPVGVGTPVAGSGTPGGRR
ncbi:MAG: ABC transporter ATP-binding protein [Actinomycetota bacterium]|nr:ABC transporter ATP-binding protein [Actinomycetota bacterium]